MTELPSCHQCTRVDHSIPRVVASRMVNSWTGGRCMVLRTRTRLCQQADESRLLAPKTDRAPASSRRGHRRSVGTISARWSQSNRHVWLREDRMHMIITCTPNASCQSHSCWAVKRSRFCTQHKFTPTQWPLVGNGPLFISDIASLLAWPRLAR